MSRTASPQPAAVGHRIVSLLPSATEIVYALGLDDALVGVTFECDYPPAARTKRVVSDTSLPEGLTPAEIDQAVTERTDAHESIYTLDEGALRTLDPDLVLTQDLCAVCAVDVSEVTDALDHLGCHAQVVTLDPKTLDQVLADIQTVADITGHPDRGRASIAGLRERLARVAAAVEGLPQPRVFVLEWTDPPFNAGHWLPDMVHAAGGEPVLARAGAYSEAVTWPAIVDAAPELMVVAPCGYDLAGTLELLDAPRPAGPPVGHPRRRRRAGVGRRRVVLLRATRTPPRRRRRDPRRDPPPRRVAAPRAARRGSAPLSLAPHPRSRWYCRPNASEQRTPTWSRS